MAARQRSVTVVVAVIVFNAGTDPSRVSMIGASEVSRCERQLVTVLAALGDSEVVAVVIFNAGTDPSRVSMIGASEVS